MQSFYKIVPPPPPFPATQTVIDRERDEAEWRRTVGVSLVICVLAAVAVFAALQARSSPRREFIPVPTEGIAAAAPPQRIYSLGGGPSPAGAMTYQRPVAASWTTANALGWEELTLMLRAGLSDEDIIAATAARPLAVAVRSAEENVLRTLGAGNLLMNNLRARSVRAAPSTAYLPTTIAPATAMPITQGSVAASAQAPVDSAAKDRQIENLKTRINTLDEQIRIIRTNPKDSRYWWHYYGRFNGIDQQALDDYLKQLDKERNDLRRQKWLLEGR